MYHFPLQSLKCTFQVLQYTFHVLQYNEERVFIIKNEGVYNYGGLPIIGRVGVVAENLTNPENTQVIDFMYHKVGDEYVEGDTLPSFYGYSAFTDSLNGSFYPGEYRLYMASRDYRDTEWQPMRIVNVGPIYYNMTVADDGTTTIGKTRGRARLHLNNASKRGE